MSEITFYEAKVNAIVNFIMSGVVRGKSYDEMFDQAKSKAGDFRADTAQYIEAAKEVKKILKNPRRMEMYRLYY